MYLQQVLTNHEGASTDISVFTERKNGDKLSLKHGCAHRKLIYIKCLWW
jgi:hypothetical protein